MDLLWFSQWSKSRFAASVLLAFNYTFIAPQILFQLFFNTLQLKTVIIVIVITRNRRWIVQSEPIMRIMRRGCFWADTSSIDTWPPNSCLLTAPFGQYTSQFTLLCPHNSLGVMHWLNLNMMVTTCLSIYWTLFLHKTFRGLLWNQLLSEQQLRQALKCTLVQFFTANWRLPCWIILRRQFSCHRCLVSGAHTSPDLLERRCRRQMDKTVNWFHLTFVCNSVLTKHDIRGNCN